MLDQSPRVSDNMRNSDIISLSPFLSHTRTHIQPNKHTFDNQPKTDGPGMSAEATFSFVEVVHVFSHNPEKPTVLSRNASDNQMTGFPLYLYRLITHSLTPRRKFTHEQWSLMSTPPDSRKLISNSPFDPLICCTFISPVAFCGGFIELLSL